MGVRERERERERVRVRERERDRERERKREGGRKYQIRLLMKVLSSSAVLSKPGKECSLFQDDSYRNGAKDFILSLNCRLEIDEEEAVVEDSSGVSQDTARMIQNAQEEFSFFL